MLHFCPLVFIYGLVSYYIDISKIVREIKSTAKRYGYCNLAIFI